MTGVAQSHAALSQPGGMMKRALALLTAGVLVGTLASHSAAAQSTAPAKTSPTSSMQHSQSSGTKSHHDSTSVKSSTATKSKWSKEQIKEAQTGLQKAGYFKATPDGVYGKKTKKAVKEYQKANNMPVTGQLSDSLLTRLSSS
jgi:peptidoglycan hydrolase-like protein with peptidoglycan-binding domain